MKDLYERLSLSPKVSESMIRRRLRRIDNEELERAAREVLLDSDRREVYDRNHRVLKIIGDLRARLSLNGGPNWRECEARRDFSVASKKYASKSHPRSESGGRTGHASTGSSGSEEETDTTRFGRALKGIGNALVMLGVLFMFSVSVIAVIDAFENSNVSESSSEETEEVSPGPNSDDSFSSSKGDTETQRDKESFSSDPEPLPENGTWWNHTSDRAIAPFRVSVSSDEHYYIKMENTFTDDLVVSLFVRSGRTAQVEVPLGTYRLKYAVGETWYGREKEKPFGPETRFFEADDTFDFEILGNQVTGHEVELILQQGGNLPTDPIPQSEF